MTAQQRVVPGDLIVHVTRSSITRMLCNAPYYAARVCGREDVVGYHELREVDDKLVMLVLSVIRGVATADDLYVMCLNAPWRGWLRSDKVLLRIVSGKR